MRLAGEQAHELRHSFIGTEHILLALLEQEDGEGVLTGLGIDKSGVAEYVTATLAALASLSQRDREVGAMIVVDNPGRPGPVGEAPGRVRGRGRAVVLTG